MPLELCGRLKMALLAPGLVGQLCPLSLKVTAQMRWVCLRLQCTFTIFYHLISALGLIYIQLCNYLLPVSRCVPLHTPVSAMMQDPGAREPKSCLLGHDWASPSPPAQPQAQHSHPEVDRLQNF